MRIIVFIVLFFTTCYVSAQDIIPKERFGDLKLGVTYEDVIWIIGFDGSKLSKDSAPEMLREPLKELNIDFDYVVNFRYIMDLPVTSVYFKEDLVVFFTISNYPEYNQFICQDLVTSDGLKFWDSLTQVKELYGNDVSLMGYTSGKIKYFVYKNDGICFGLDDDEVRTIGIFNPEFK